MDRLRWLVHGLLVAVLLGASAPWAGAADGAQDFDRWYVLLMQGERAGWMRATQTTDEQGRVFTDNQMEMKLLRMNQEMEISMRSRFVETADGEPLRMAVRQDMGMSPQETRYIFKDGHVIEKSRQLGRTIEKERPLPPGPWLTPAETRAFVAKRLEAGATEIVYSTLDPFVGLDPMKVATEVIGETTVEVMGKTVPAVEWRTTNSYMPSIETVSFVDDQGVDIRSKVSFGVVDMDVIAADKELALSAFTAPELMATTMVQPDRPIERPRTLRRAEFLVRATNGDLPDMDAGGAQRVERIDDGSARIIVDLDAMPAALPAEAEDPKYREASRTADSDDPRVRALVAEATKGVEGDPLDRARAMRSFVHRYVEYKDLGVGFATASEVSETQQGDCSEHGVLLAAMLRADGIPSRVVSGLVYVDQFMTTEQSFGYHMWTQGLFEVDGEMRWIDLDATLPGGCAFDAAHIGITTSSLADDDVINSMVPLATVLGNLEIEVVSP